MFHLPEQLVKSYNMEPMVALIPSTLDTMRERTDWGDLLDN